MIFDETSIWWTHFLMHARESREIRLHPAVPFLTVSHPERSRAAGIATCLLGTTRSFTYAIQPLELPCTWTDRSGRTRLQIFRAHCPVPIRINDYLTIGGEVASKWVHVAKRLLHLVLVESDETTLLRARLDVDPQVR